MPRTALHPLGGGGIRIDTTPIRFDYTGSVQDFIVPKGVKKLQVDCVGASGGNITDNTVTLGGFGGRVQTILAVTPGETLYLYVGGKGGDKNGGTGGSIGGWNGGGSDGGANMEGGTGGGGASDIRTILDNLNSRKIVAGGGGGTCHKNTANQCGGNGGGLIGESGRDANGTPNGTYAGKGGTQTAGGVGKFNGVLGIGGSNGYGSGTGLVYSGGGGGGGYYGGGSGNQVNAMRYVPAGGGGGSSYTDPELCSDVIHTQGYSEATGNGWIILTPLEK